MRESKRYYGFSTDVQPDLTVYFNKLRIVKMGSRTSVYVPDGSLLVGDDMSYALARSAVYAWRGKEQVNVEIQSIEEVGSGITIQPRKTPSLNSMSHQEKNAAITDISSL